MAILSSRVEEHLGKKKYNLFIKFILIIKVNFYVQNTLFLKLNLFKTSKQNLSKDGQTFLKYDLQ